MQGRHEVALAGYQQALAISLAQGAEADPLLSQRYGDVAVELEALGRAPEALEALRQARDAAQRARGTDLEAALLGCDVARLSLDVGDTTTAFDEAARALKALEGRDEEDPANVAACRFVVAQVWWSRPAERKRAVALATEAARSAEPELAGEIAAWLRARR
jgi:tetratricopeptide (TPR) repeat protein